MVVGRGEVRCGAGSDRQRRPPLRDGVSSALVLGVWGSECECGNRAFLEDIAYLRERMW